MNQPNSHCSKVLHYNFSPEEINVLFRFVMSIGYVDRRDEELNRVINRICQIADYNELAKRDNQAT